MVTIQRSDDLRPQYPIKAVARMTGLNPATLRAWEKRYGVPAPVRSPSRYRLYAGADVKELQWMKARVEEGVPPRQAARLALERREAGGAPGSRTSVDPRVLLVDLKTAWLAYDEDGALEVLRRAASISAPHEILRGVLFPAIAEIGRDWEAGLVTVAQEHFSSQMARRFAHRLMDLHQPRSGLPPVVCACAPGEQHELGLLAFTAEVRRRAYPAVYLGPDVPVESVLSALERLHATVAMVSVTLAEHLAPWAAAGDEVARALRRAGSTIVWGGPAADAVATCGLPGLAATTIDEAVDLVVRLIETGR